MFLRSAFPASAALSAWLLAACAQAPPPPSVPGAAPIRTGLEKTLARAVSKGDWDRVFRAADSAAAAPDPVGREIALYWKSMAWLYRDRPDSAVAILEAQQGKWSAGMRKVHAALMLKLARDAAARTPDGPDEAPKPSADRALQDRMDALERESSALRAENLRLETEKEKYRKLLKDLETIR